METPSVFYPRQAAGSPNNLLQTRCAFAHDLPKRPLPNPLSTCNGLRTMRKFAVRMIVIGGEDQVASPTEAQIKSDVFSYGTAEKDSTGRKANTNGDAGTRAVHHDSPFCPLLEKDDGRCRHPMSLAYPSQLLCRCRLNIQSPHGDPQETGDPLTDPSEEWGQARPLGQ